MRRALVLVLALSACGESFEAGDVDEGGRGGSSAGSSGGTRAGSSSGGKADGGRAGKPSTAGRTGGTTSESGSAGTSSSSGTGGTPTAGTGAGGDAGEPSNGGEGGTTTAGTGGDPAAGSSGTGAAGSSSGSAGTTAGDGGSSGTGGTTTWPEPEHVEACDPDGPGTQASGYEIAWTVPPGSCFKWTGTAQKPTCGECLREDPPGTCAGGYADTSWTLDPVTGCENTVSVLPNEPARVVRLNEDAIGQYTELVGDECPLSDCESVREDCLLSCFSARCCYIADARTTTCDEDARCQGIDP